MEDLFTTLAPGVPLPKLIVAGLLGTVIFSAGLAVDVFVVAYLVRKPARWRERIDRVRSRPWAWRDGAMLLLAVLTAHAIFVAGYMARHGYAPDSPDRFESFPIVIQTILFHGAAAGTILLLLRVHGLTWLQAFGRNRGRLLRDAFQGVLLYVGAIPPVALLSLLYRLILSSFGFVVEPQGVITVFVSPDCPLWMKVYLAAMAVLVAPVIEEICFRGVALPLIARRGSIGSAVVFVSLLFAAMHFHVPSVAPLFGIAVAFSLAYIYTGSIVVPVVMHMLFNGISISVLLLLKDMHLF